MLLASRFSALLSEVEPLEDETLEDLVSNIDEMAGAVTNVLNSPELHRRAWEVARRLRLENSYPKLKAPFSDFKH